MYFNIDNRDKGYKDELEKFIKENYFLNVIALHEAPRGWYGETWVVKTPSCKYFIKIIYYKKQAKKYQKSFKVLEFMKINGINFVSQVVKTKHNTSYLKFNSGILSLFQFIDGKHVDDNPTLFSKEMAKVYKLPKMNFKIEKEKFATNDILKLKKKVRKLQNKEIEAFQIITLNWNLLIEVSKKQKYFAKLSKEKTNELFITTGDVGGNTLIDNNGAIKIIDWDYIKLAPAERDFWWYIQDSKQIDEINNSFKEEGLNYKLTYEIIGFYACKQFIFFLGEYIECLLFNSASRTEIIRLLNEYFDENGYFRKCLKYLEKF